MKVIENDIYVRNVHGVRTRPFVKGQEVEDHIYDHYVGQFETFEENKEVEKTVAPPVEAVPATQEEVVAPAVTKETKDEAPKKGK